MQIIEYEIINPTEENHYCIFNNDLENDPLILFHLTSQNNFDSIKSKGFLSSAELCGGELTSVSYAKNSSGCFANKGNVITENSVIFCVKFETLNMLGITENTSDIHVFKKEIQPSIIGFCKLPNGFRIA